MSKSKLAVSAGFLSMCLIFPLISRGAGSAGKTLTIEAEVEPFAEWDPAGSYAIAHGVAGVNSGDWTGNITATNQSRTLTTAKDLTLFANTSVIVTPSEIDGKAGALTGGAGTATALTTEYWVAGPEITGHADADYIASGTFMTKHYDVTHDSTKGVYVLTMKVRITSSASRAPNAGTYSCNVILTASW